MCGRYELHSDITKVMEAFNVEMTDMEITPRYNIAPTQTVPIVVNRGNGNRLELARWGLIPRWAKNPGIGSRMINARAETLQEKRAFKGLLRSNRCVAVADGFYEWKKEGGRKVPMYVRLKDRRPFGFAALCSTWKNPEDVEMMTFTIVTTAANDLLGEIHDRMPAILSKMDEEKWLDPETASPEVLGGLLMPYPGDEMETYEVAPLVNKPANDSPENIRSVV
jgi:putative SOS response-associated peptidase YedK